jgi:hypothetical protein
MTGPVDPERLAALLDNRLDPKERDDVLRQLASSEDAREAFGDAAAVLREIEESDKPSGAVGPAKEGGGGASADAWRRWFRSPAFRSALAAAIVIAVALPVALRTWGNRSQSVEVSGFTAALSDTGALPADWNAQPWSAHRGAEAPLSDTARAVRLGARLTDLELSIRARDTMSIAFASAAASLLAELPVSGPAATAIRSVGADTGASPAVRLERLSAARRLAEALVARDALEEGGRLEAARIAAYRRDTAFFRVALSGKDAGSLFLDSDRALVTRAAQAQPADSITWLALGTQLDERLAKRAR